MSYSTKGVNVIFKGEKDGRYGYLKLSYRQNDKTKIKSLGIKVLKSQFNKRTQLMRSNADDAEKINEIILLKKSSFGFVSYKTNQPKTIVSYIQSTINNTIVKSTKQKYENLCSLFKQFLNEKYGKTDLYFENFDEQTVADLYYWLKTKKTNPNNNNTANYKIKNFKYFISKIEKKGLYHYHISPFVSMELSFEETKKEFLNINELKTFIRTDFKDTRLKDKIVIKNQDIKDAFIFSTLAQGLRISDILTLRWNDFNFNDEYISDKSTLLIRKKMIKTKKMVSVFINTDSVVYLENNIERIFKTYLDEIKEITKYDEYKNIISTLQHYNVLRTDIDDLGKKIQNIKSDNFFGDIDLRTEYTDPKLMKKIVNKPYQQKITKSIKDDLDILKINLFLDIHTLISFLSSNPITKTKFIFPFLDDKLFSSIKEDNDFSRIDDAQFLQFQGKRSYTNLLLKKMMRQIVSNKNITFHSSRHTYTSLMLDIDEDGMNMYDLMRMLGHTSLLSTEKYARGLNSQKINKLNANLTNALFLDEEEKKDELNF